MKIKVLQHHIDQGRPGSVVACAVALAVKEQFPEAEYVCVHGIVRNDSPVNIKVIVDRKSWITEPWLWDWIYRFDNYGYVEPVEFDLPEHI